MKKTKPSPSIDPLDVFDPARWGLCLPAILDLGMRLYRFWERYRQMFASRTRDTSANAYLYLRGVLTLERERNFKNMARRLGNGEDGQALQHFMSTSPWERGAVFRQIQADLRAIPALRQGSMVSWMRVPTPKRVSRVLARLANAMGGWAKSMCVRWARIWRMPMWRATCGR